MQFDDKMITNLGLHVALPLMILGLFMIIWDLVKKSKPGRLGTIMIFLILGGGFITFIIKEIMVWIFEKNIS